MTYKLKNHCTSFEIKSSEERLIHALCIFAREDIITYGLRNENGIMFSSGLELGKDVPFQELRGIPRFHEAGLEGLEKICARAFQFLYQKYNINHEGFYTTAPAVDSSSEKYQTLLNQLLELQDTTKQLVQSQVIDLEDLTR